MDNSNKPNLRLYCGATGSGKGVSVREYIERLRPGRLMVWDPLNEYGKFGRLVTTIEALSQGAKAHAFKLVYYPGPDSEKFGPKFALFCRIAFAAGNLVMLVEELADLTKPAHAPMAWRQCTKKGRHAGLQIVAATQRPADIDKHFLGGCTYIRAFTQRFPADRKALSGAMGVPVVDLESLQTVETPKGKTILNWIEKDFRTGTTVRGSKTMG